MRTWRRASVATPTAKAYCPCKVWVQVSTMPGSQSPPSEGVAEASVRRPLRRTFWVSDVDTYLVVVDLRSPSRESASSPPEPRTGPAYVPWGGAPWGVRVVGVGRRCPSRRGLDGGTTRHASPLSSRVHYRTWRSGMSRTEGAARAQPGCAGTCDCTHLGVADRVASNGPTRAPYTAWITGRAVGVSGSRPDSAGCPEMTQARSTVVFRWIASYGSITIVQTTVRGDGSIRMPSWVIESSQPGAVVVSAVVPVLSQDIDVTLVSPEPPSRKFT